MKTQPDPKILEYLNKGGKMFDVERIHRLRDGGTQKIETTDISYYVDKETNQFHNHWPCANKNKVTDELLIYVLLNRMDRYVERVRIEYINAAKTLNATKINHYFATPEQAFNEAFGL